MKKPKYNPPIPNWFFGGVLLILTLVVIAVICFFFHSNIEIEKLGPMGDYFGGMLNPLISFVTVVLLIFAGILTREQLNKTQDQLDLGREEYNRKQIEDILKMRLQRQENLINTHLPVAFNASNGNTVTSVKAALAQDQYGGDICTEMIKAWKNKSSDCSPELSQILNDLDENIENIYILLPDLLLYTHVDNIKTHWMFEVEKYFRQCVLIGVRKADDIYRMRRPIDDMNTQAIQEKTAGKRR